MYAQTVLAFAVAYLTIAPLKSETIQFQKVRIDARFVSEGVAVGDVNRDGRMDVLAGNVWYAAPDWERHEIGLVTRLEPKTQYSNCFNTWAADLNGDGWVDQILIGMPGEKAVWRENPKGKEEPWKEHPIWRSAGNESPLYEDLFRDGRKVLIMGTDDQYLAWFEPAADPYAEWTCHPISELKGAGSQRYSHGLGIGDLDGDGKNEVLTTKGFYSRRAPSPGRSGDGLRSWERGDPEHWTFTVAELGPDCAHMRLFERGILSTSAHARGVWWFEPDGKGGFRRATLDETVSQTHAANLALLGAARTPNLITGKRKWAHPPGVDVGSEEASWLVRYEWAEGKWTRHLIDEDSGVGTQFVTEDMNGDGRVDIVVSNKNGVLLFLQKSG